MDLQTDYNTIKQYYGDRCATRSGLPLMNHIDEGIELLKVMNASEVTIQSYILHPIVQVGDDETWDVKDRPAYDLACEYRDFANAYLCNVDTDWIETTVDLGYHIHEVTGYPISFECVQMLIADKLQNRKDFLIHHLGTHARSDELHAYFNRWLDYLYLSYNKKKTRYA